MFKNKYLNRFGENFIWLFIWNNLAYIFSFLTLPILIFKYGHKEMGVIFTIQALILGLSAIANYSFTFYIPTQSKIISDSEKSRNSFWNEMVSVRLLLSILLGSVSIIIVQFYFTKYLLLWLLSLPILFVKVINPVLICNAIENNKTILKIGFFSKLFFLLCIYFTHNSNLVNLFFGFSEFVVILYFLSEMNLSFFNIRFIGITKVIFALKKTFNLFLVNLFSLLKPASILPTISYFLGSEYATHYTLAEKIINAIRGFSGAAFVSFFPIYAKEKIRLLFFSLKNSSIILVLSAISVIVIWIISPYLIYYLNDFSVNNMATKTLQILSLSIPMYFIIIPLFSFLLENKKWNIILLIAIFQLLVLAGLILSFHQNIIQVAVAFVISEYVLLISYVIYIFQIRKDKN